ncbi:hypothetical protein IAT38_003160 [Cryptococcus sp. DSM 104549]
MAIQPPPPPPPRSRHTRSPSTPDHSEDNPHSTASPRTPNHPSDDQTPTYTTNTAASGTSVRTPTSGHTRPNPYEPPNLSGAPLAQRRGSPQVVELDDGVRSLAGSVGYAGGSDGSEAGCSADEREGGEGGREQGGEGSEAGEVDVSTEGRGGGDDGEETKSENPKEDTPRGEHERTLGSDPEGEGNNRSGNASDAHSDPFPYSCSNSQSNLLHNLPQRDTFTDPTTPSEESTSHSTSGVPSLSEMTTNATQEWFAYLEGLGVRLKEDMEGIEEVRGLVWVMKGLPGREKELGEELGYTTAAEEATGNGPPPESTIETTILTLCAGSTYNPRPLVLFIITTAEPVTTNNTASASLNSTPTLEELLGLAVYRAIMAVHLARKTHPHATRAFVEVEGCYALIETGGDGVYQIHVYGFGDVGLRVGREKAVGDLMEGVVQAWVDVNQDEGEADWKAAVEGVVEMFKNGAIDQFMAGVGEPEEGLVVESSSTDCRERLIFDGVRVCVPDAAAMKRELRKKRAGAGAAA